MSERLIRFPGSSWHEIEALPQPMRWTVQRTIFPLLDDPIPALASPFPHDDPLPGAYELHLPADDVTIWYGPFDQHEVQEVISMQHVSLDTWDRRDQYAASPPLLVNVSVSVPGEEGTGFIPVAIEDAGFGVTNPAADPHEEILRIFNIDIEVPSSRDGTLIFVRCEHDA